jgi:hypothetical protein
MGIVLELMMINEKNKNERAVCKGELGTCCKYEYGL